MNTGHRIDKGIILVVALTTLLACSRQEAAPVARKKAPSPPELTGVSDIVARDFVIESPNELPLGWNTFHFRNEGRQTHFVVLYRMPDGKTLEDQLRETVPAFQKVMNGLRSGELTKADIGPKLGEWAPAWAFQVVYVGGPGLLTPGHSSTTSIYLDTPGTYLMECYMKSPDGMFHSAMGMLKQVQVVERESGLAEPVADMDISVGDEGIAAPPTVATGQHRFKVSFVKDSTTAPMPYDVHLARLTGGTGAAEVATWMDWSNIGGLADPAPAEFLGGVENMKQGSTAYLDVTLTPGHYLWISEVNAERINQPFVVE